MVQVDKTPKGSNSSGGWAGGDGNGNGNSNENAGIGNIGRSFKKQKQKKVPQRGLGVAQLEKIRLEEQQTKDAAALATVTVLSSPLVPNESSFLSIPIPHYNHSNQSFSSLPFVDLSSANSIFSPHYSTQNINVRKPNTISFPNNDGFELPGHAHVPKFWNSYDYNLEKEYPRGLDPGLVLHSPLNFPYESKPICPLNIQRTQYHQLCPSMVNVQSSTSSSVLNYQMEPPSNQNYYGVPLCSEEEKVGMKRPCPCTGAFASVPLRADALLLHRSIEGTNDLDPSNQKLRKGTCSMSVVSESNLKNNNKDKNHPNGDFLTLSPSANRTCPPSSKLDNPSTYPKLQNLEMLEFNALPCQGSEKSFKPASSRSREQHAFYNFLTQGKEQNDEIATSLHEWNEDEEVSVDLNLTL